MGTERVIDETEKVGKSTTEVLSRMSTQPIGVFPRFCEKVADLIENSTESLDILCAEPAYAAVSDVRSFGRYLAALSNRQRSDKVVRVRMVYLEEDARKELFQDQVQRHHDEWIGWYNDRVPRLEQYSASFGPRVGLAGVDLKTLNFEEMWSSLLKADGLIISALAGQELFESVSVMPLQVWIADQSEAIFSIVSPKTMDDEVGFYTTDPTLVSALKGIVDSYLETARARNNSQRVVTRPQRKASPARRKQ